MLTRVKHIRQAIPPFVRNRTASTLEGACVAQLSVPAQLAVWRSGVRPSRFILTVSVGTQTMLWFERSCVQPLAARFPRYELRRRFVVSTSRFGIGQEMHSNQTPLGLHQIAEKIGGGQPLGTVFQGRQPIGSIWLGQPQGTIVHRILWLEGLQPGFNRGGNVDSHQRYIYIHGFSDETTLGRPQSHGCIHLAGADLLLLYERVPVGTLVWIAER